MYQLVSSLVLFGIKMSHQRMSLIEWKSSVILGIAVTIMMLSSARQKTESARATKVRMKGRLLSLAACEVGMVPASSSGVLLSVLFLASCSTRLGVTCCSIETGQISKQSKLLSMTLDCITTGFLE